MKTNKLWGRIEKLEQEIQCVKVILRKEEDVVETPVPMFFHTTFHHHPLMVVDICDVCGCTVRPYERRSQSEVQIVVRCSCPDSQKVIHQHFL